MGLIAVAPLELAKRERVARVYTGMFRPYPSPGSSSATRRSIEGEDAAWVVLLGGRVKAVSGGAKTPTTHRIVALAFDDDSGESSEGAKGISAESSREIFERVGFFEAAPRGIATRWRAGTSLRPPAIAANCPQWGSRERSRGSLWRVRGTARIGRVGAFRAPPRDAVAANSARLEIRGSTEPKRPRSTVDLPTGKRSGDVAVWRVSELAVQRFPRRPGDHFVTTSPAHTR
jgi:hypothetical protein